MTANAGRIYSDVHEQRNDFGKGSARPTRTAAAQQYKSHSKDQFHQKQLQQQYSGYGMVARCAEGQGTRFNTVTGVSDTSTQRHGLKYMALVISIVCTVGVHLLEEKRCSSVHPILING